ncbi:MAG TPA: ABC transporter permease [Opitutaceae bacterium]|nr:ABC transporter permease [Opitutaceae bacterium]
MIRAIYAVIILDLKRFWLDRARLVAGLAQPLLYLFVLGSGLGASSRLGGPDYQRYIFAGVLALSLLFTATFAAITIVFDRQIGFFKAVLVAPVPRSAIAFGKIIAGALQAFVQAAIVVPFAPLAGVHLTVWTVCVLLAAMFLGALTFSAIGVAIASRFNSTTVFPIVSNAVLLPMFFLSGALYPLDVAPHWMKIAAHFDPVAYAVDLMRGALRGQYFFQPAGGATVLILLILVLGLECVRIFNRGEDDSVLGATQFGWARGRSR